MSADEHLPLVFLHNLKTGGTTLRNIIVREYRPDEVYTAPSRTYDPGELARLSAIDVRTVRVIQGHIPFGVHRYLPCDVAYVTLLRDPVERIISLYYFLLQGRLTRLRPQVGPHLRSIEDFVEHGRLLEVDNEQTRRLSGMNPPFGGCTPEMLDVAKRNLRERFAAVGLTERFDESLIVFKRAFGWRSVVYVRENVTKAKPARDAIPAEARRAIERHNQLDLALYAYAEGLFAETIAGLGPDVQAEARALAFLNAECARRGKARRRRPEPTIEPERAADVAVRGLPMLLDAHTRLLRREAELKREVERLRQGPATHRRAGRPLGRVIDWTRRLRRVLNDTRRDGW